MRTSKLLAIVFLLALAVPAALPGQAAGPPAAPNAVYFEIGGNALLYSFNYERRFQDRLSGRVGLMYVGVEGTSGGESAEVDVLLIPVMINGLLGDGSGRFEIGFGPLLGAASGRVSTLEGAGEFSGFGLAGVTSTIGYRYQPRDGGLVFRAGLAPFWSGDPQLWAGLSLGYAF